MSSKQILETGKAAFKAGRYLECAQILEKAARAAETESTNDESLDHDSKAELYIEYGRALQKLANYEESGEFLNKARAILEAGDTITQLYIDCVYELGMLGYEQDLLEDAEIELKDALDSAYDIYEPPHENIAKVLQGLAEVAWKGGDHSHALSLAEEAMEMQKQTIGEEHEDYAESVEVRALAILYMGRLDEAEVGFRECLEIRKACLPEDHAYFATSYSNLAHCLGRQGKDEGVEEMIQRAVEICTKSYGEYSPRTAVVINNLGGYHLDHGNLNEAAKYFERGLELKEKVLGKDSQALLKSLNNLAVVYGMLNRKADAQEMSQRASALMKSKIASSDQKDVDTMILLADRLSVSKQHAEADAVLAQALDAATQEYGIDSLKVAQVLHHMAAKAQNTGDSDKSLEYYRALLRIQKKQLGKKHPKVAETLRGISLSLMMQGLGDVAELLNQQAQAIEHSAGLEDPQIAAMQNVFNRERDKKGPKDHKVIQSLRTLSEMYRMRGKTEKANELFEEYLQLREEEVGPDSLEFARELSVKAMSSMPIQTLAIPSETAQLSDEIDDDLKEHIADSIKFLEKALAIQERHLAQAKENDELLTTLESLATARMAARQYDEAKKNLLRSVELIEQSVGTNHWRLQGPLRQLKVILDRQGNDEEAAAIEARLKDLPTATPEEQQETMTKIMERMLGSMGSMLEGLASLPGMGGPDNTDEDLAPLAGFSNLQETFTALGALGLNLESNEGSLEDDADSAEQPESLLQSIQRRIAEERSKNKDE